MSDKEKIGAAEIRKAYYQNWYDSCKEIYNKNRRLKRKQKKLKGEDNGKNERASN